MFEAREIIGETSPLVHVDPEGLALDSPGERERINRALYQALEMVHPFHVSGQALVKVHIGEPSCVTRMKPEYVVGSARFLRDKGARGVVAGDTTVAYSGQRGHKQNPSHDVSSYLALAREHGWTMEGPAGLPFVVLDRPVSAMPGRFEFSDEFLRTDTHGIGRFKDFYPAGGFEAAGFVINHAHLTMHGLAGVAGCVKSISMGCSSLRGKLRMHQALLPRFDPELCERCLECVDNCPEDAVAICADGGCPEADPELCIGCGECEAVCPGGAVTLAGQEITDWQRGEDTLYLRMSDYALGLMEKKRDNIIHVLHMYNVTERCDCLDKKQEPMITRDLGFLVGKNPFAVDWTAARMLARAAEQQGAAIDGKLMGFAAKTAEYVATNYRIMTGLPVTRLAIA